MKKLKDIILENEEILMETVLNYAKERNYVKYTSTLKEAWRMSISGLSKSLIKIIEKSSIIPEMGPDDDFANNEVAEFGVIEAQRHRSRGVTLGMFMGLMKYYAQSYADLVNESNFSPEEKKYFNQYIKRYFDHVELGYVIEWTGLREKQKLEELQETNRKMTNEKNKYLTIFESIYDPIILVDKDNNIENINYKAAEVFLGIKVPGMKYYSNIEINKELEWLNEKLIKIINLNENENEVLVEETIETKVGKKTFVIKFKKMLDVSEKYRGTVIIFSDITERIKIEKELEKQNQRLKSTQLQLVQSEKMAGLGTLVAGVAHEINNPTNYVYLSSKTLKKDIDNFRKEVMDMLSGNDDEIIHYFEENFAGFYSSLNDTLDGSNRIKMIVADLRKFSRLDEAEKKEIFIAEALESTLRLVKTQFNKQIEFIKDFKTNGNIECYPAQLNQVFLNIIVNSCHAILKKQNDSKNEGIGSVTIQLSDNGNELVIAFKDSGCGMTEEEKNKIFEPFFTTKPVGQGTGLGMSISYGIIQKHHGKIEAESEQGIGTTITVFLPYRINYNQ
jgi:diguanylate cyclase